MTTRKDDGAEGSPQAPAAEAGGIEASRAPLYAVLGANGVSQVGDLMVAVAMPWFVLETTGSVVQMGFTGAVVGVGALLASVVGGPLVDRLDFRRASVLSDLTSGAAVAAIPVLYWLDALPFGAFLTLALVISILNAPGDLARRALMPTLAAWAAMPLERANAADTAIPRFAQLVGPLLGGVLVAVAGAANVLLLNALTFFVSAVAVALMVPALHAPGAAVGTGARERHHGARSHHVFADLRLARSPLRQYASDLREGFLFVRTNGLIISLVVVIAVANLLEKPLMSVVAPTYAEEYYGGAASFGAMLGAFGAGAILGTLGFSVVGHRLPRRVTFVACLLTAPLVMFGSLAATLTLPVLLAAVALAGVLFGPMNAISATAIQEVTPPNLLGRVFGTVSALSMLGIPLGATAVGLILAEVGLVGTLLGMGAIYLALGIATAVNPVLSTMDRDGPRPHVAT